MRSALIRAAYAALAVSAFTGSELGSWPAGAQTTDTSTLSVTATVATSCALSSGTLDFGTYTSGQTTPRDATGQFAFTNCDGTLTFELDGGQSGSVSARAMTSGGNSLSYQLFRDSSRTAVFGTGSDAQQVLLLTPQNGTVSVYGRIDAGQVAAAGTYSDTVNITLTF